MLKQLLKFLFKNRGDVKASMNNRLGVFSYPRALQFLAFVGILMGACFIYHYITRSYLHWPLSSTFLLISTCAYVIFCIMMIYIGTQSDGSIVMWISIAVVNISNLFFTLHFPGSLIMGYYGIPHLIALLFAIGYIVYLPQEYQWARKALSWWVILPQIVLLGTYFGHVYVRNAFYPDITPIIPYAYDNVYRAASGYVELFFSLAYGLSILPFSIWLYIVAKRQCKKTGK